MGGGSLPQANMSMFYWGGVYRRLDLFEVQAIIFMNISLPTRINQHLTKIYPEK